MHKTGNDSFSNVSNFFEMIKYHRKLKLWFPKFGGGIFLHWNKVLDYCNTSPVLLSSAFGSMILDDWLSIFKMKKFENIPLKFATDHPFNDLVSIKSYNVWKTFKNQK